MVPHVLWDPHFSWWAHELFPALCESSEVSRLLLSAGFPPASGSLRSCLGRSVVRQRFTGTLQVSPFRVNQYCSEEQTQVCHSGVEVDPEC